VAPEREAPRKRDASDNRLSGRTPVSVLVSVATVRPRLPRVAARLHHGVNDRRTVRNIGSRTWKAGAARIRRATPYLQQQSAAATDLLNVVVSVHKRSGSGQ
jgi:hypothetical protein